MGKTEIQTLEEAKDKLEEYLDIFNSLPVGIYRTCIDDGTFLKANPECATMLGYENADQMFSKIKSVDLYYDISDREAFIKALQETGSLKHYELPLKTAQGDKLWVAVTARINKDKGYLEGSLMDITRSKNLAEELERYKAEEAKHLMEINMAAKKRLDKINKCNGEDVYQVL